MSESAAPPEAPVPAPVQAGTRRVAVKRGIANPGSWVTIGGKNFQVEIDGGLFVTCGPEITDKQIEEAKLS